MSMQPQRIQQLDIPDELLGTLVEYQGDLDDHASLLAQLDHQGYLLLRDVLDRSQVMSARREVFDRLAAVGEIRSPAELGIATGESQRREVAGDLDAFWREVSSGEALRTVTHGTCLQDLMARVLGEPARPHDLIYLRPMSVGQVTRLHYDFPFFARYSTRIQTAWVPLGEIPQNEGPLLIVEGSNRFLDWTETIRNHDYQNDHTNEVVQRAAYEQPNATDPITLARQRGVRLLSTDFCPGDVVVFSGFTLHGSLDNCSTIDRVRLSCDVRFQPATDSIADERYFGSHPSGSLGGGYGDMRAARPLSEL